MTTQLEPVHQGAWMDSGGAVTVHEDGRRTYEECDLNWRIRQSPTYFDLPDVGKTRIPNRVTLWHGENNTPLGIVSERFKVVQPTQVIETFRHLAQSQAMDLQFAGPGNGGRKLWGLADTGRSMELPGEDKVSLYLMFLTACDGTMSTRGILTTIRALCSNMLQMVLDEGLPSVTLPHSREYDVKRLEAGLAPGLEAWDDYMNQAIEMAGRRLTKTEVGNFVREVMGNPELELDDPKQPHQKNMAEVIQLFGGRAAGSELPSAKGTLWGLINAVTEFNDHHRRARSARSRFDSTAFGFGAREKRKAWTEGLKLVA